MKEAQVLILTLPNGQAVKRVFKINSGGKKMT